VLSDNLTILKISFMRFYKLVKLMCVESILKRIQIIKISLKSKINIKIICPKNIGLGSLGNVLQ